MRIALVIHKFPPESLGGTEIYAWSLGRALARLGHRVDVFYPAIGLSPRDARSERDGMHLWRVPLPATRQAEGPASQFWHSIRSATVEEAFRRFLDEADPDVVHIQHLQNVSARIIPLAQGRPRIVTLHDYWYLCPNGQLIRHDRSLCPGNKWTCGRCALGRADLDRLAPLAPLVGLPFGLRNLYLRRLLGEIDLLVSPSHFLRDLYLRNEMPIRGRVVVLENGLDRERLAPWQEAALPEPPGRPHLIFVGSIAWQKGVHVLVEAMNRLPPNCGLTIYGDPTTFADYAQAVQRSARHSGIRFAGRIDHRRVGDALRQADYVVVPSLWYENSPVVIQEAYTMGVPVIASDLGALREKVIDGVTGRLFAPGDADDLARVVRDEFAHPERRAGYGDAMRPAPDIITHAEKLLERYRALLSSSRSHH